MYGPQKGVTPEMAPILERGLEHLADLVARDLGHDYRDMPGSGAAGGLGFGLLSFCGAEMRSGFRSGRGSRGAGGGDRGLRLRHYRGGENRCADITWERAGGGGGPCAKAWEAGDRVCRDARARIAGGGRRRCSTRCLRFGARSFRWSTRSKMPERCWRRWRARWRRGFGTDRFYLSWRRDNQISRDEA